MKQYRLNRHFNAKSAGLETSVGIMSADHPQFREIALNALPFTDHPVINEVEASRVLRTSLGANDPVTLLDAARQLLVAGVLRSMTIQTERGAVTAGLLYGLHEGWPIQERLRLAACTAASSLADLTPSKGVQSVQECLALADKFRFGPFGQAA